MSNVKQIEDAKIKSEYELKNNLTIFFEERWENGDPLNNVEYFNDIKGYQATSFADVAVFVVQMKDDKQFIYKMNNINRIETFITKE